MKILVAEDDQVSRIVIQKYLSTLGQVSVAENGAQAIQMFKEAFEGENRYDLLCLDIMMPEMSGQQVLLDVREFEKEKGIPVPDGVKVIMTTGLNDAENVVGAFKNGCEAYITKPIDKKQLVSEIKKLGLYVASE